MHNDGLNELETYESCSCCDGHGIDEEGFVCVNCDGHGVVPHDCGAECA